jgi:hypothetical protein
MSAASLSTARLLLAATSLENQGVAFFAGGGREWKIVAFYLSSISPELF